MFPRRIIQGGAPSLALVSKTRQWDEVVRPELKEGRGRCDRVFFFLFWVSVNIGVFG